MLSQRLYDDEDDIIIRRYGTKKTRVMIVFEKK